MRAGRSPPGFGGNRRRRKSGRDTRGPAGSNRQGDVNSGLLEFIGTCCRLRHTSYGGVGDNYLDRLAVGITDILLKELCRCLRHIHSLILKGFPHSEIAPSAVDGGTNAYHGIISYQSACCHCEFLLSKYFKLIVNAFDYIYYTFFAFHRQ